MYDAVQIGVELPRAELDQRIADRVTRMWELGLVSEVRQLAAAGLRDGRTASRALGYAQVLRFLDGELSEAEAAAQTVLATRRFVRRQESWFRRDPRIRWVQGAGPHPGPGHGRLARLSAAPRIRRSDRLLARGGGPRAGPSG